MKSFLFFLILITAGCAAGFGAAKWKAMEVISSKLAGHKGVERISEFRASLFPLENLPFCIVIIGRNNGAYLEKTLQSAFSQNYENFRIVYIDDASDDGSYELARDLLYGNSRFRLAQFIHREEPLGFLANLSQAVMGCSDQEIVVVLNGEDWLAHEWVLTRLNQYYADPDLWLTYGQSCDYPSYQLGNARPLQEAGRPLRSLPLPQSHLKTFYAALFKKINTSDFQYRGEYFQAAGDLAYMFPMFEMARGHSQCLADVLYISNRACQNGEDRERQSFFEKHIRSLQPYPELASLKIHEASVE